MKKRYEILDALPVYGPMYISVTENGGRFFSTGFVVRFFKSDGTDWVANFAPSWTRLNQIIELNATSNLLVIAGGVCYVMNPDETKPLTTFGVDYTSSFNASNNRIVLESNTNLTIVEANESYWHTEQISWDGLRVKAVEEHMVYGTAHDPTGDGYGWVDFTYDLDTKTLSGGSYQQHPTKTPSWKFW